MKQEKELNDDDFRKRNCTHGSVCTCLRMTKHTNTCKTEERKKRYII